MYHTLPLSRLPHPPSTISHYLTLPSQPSFFLHHLSSVVTLVCMFVFVFIPHSFAFIWCNLGASFSFIYVCTSLTNIIAHLCVLVHAYAYFNVSASGILCNRYNFFTFITIADHGYPNYPPSSRQPVRPVQPSLKSSRCRLREH